MGLIGVVLEALYAGGQAVVMPPLAFLQRPSRWLEAIDTYRATISGAPNFAYDLCVSAAFGADARRPLDLARKLARMAFCGAEPIRAETLRRFADAFAPHGFDASALYPTYGLAEATVFVSGGDVGAGLRTLPGVGRTEMVSCGRAWDDGAITIVDPESAARAAGRQPRGNLGRRQPCGGRILERCGGDARDVRCASHG